MTNRCKELQGGSLWSLETDWAIDAVGTRQPLRPGRADWSLKPDWSLWSGGYSWVAGFSPDIELHYCRCQVGDSETISPEGSGVKTQQSESGT